MAGDPGGLRGFVLIVGRDEREKRGAGALLVATLPTDDDPAWIQRAVAAVTTLAAARTVGGQDLVVRRRVIALPSDAIERMFAWVAGCEHCSRRTLRSVRGAGSP
jgi:hypothetical protein